MNIESVSSKLSFHITEHLFKTWISQTYKALVTKEATKKQEPNQESGESNSLIDASEALFKI